MTHWHDTMVDRPETDGAVYITGWTISGLAVLGAVVAVWLFGIYPRSEGALKGTLGAAKALYRFAIQIRALICLQKKTSASSAPQILQMVQPSRFNREYACPQ